MEERIYARQIMKEGMSKRVIDATEPRRHFTQMEVREFYTFKPEVARDDGSQPLPQLLDIREPKDLVFQKLIDRQRQWIKKVSEHETLLGELDLRAI